MTNAFVYILECSDGSYYTGSTIDLQSRIEQHQNGLGVNHTKNRLPVKLVYAEDLGNIDEAFRREKQIQGWSRKKKEALIKRNFSSLPRLSVAHRDQVSSRTSDTRKYYSNGKLLLTGEYVVLDGAKALAIPTNYGQSLNTQIIEDSCLKWKSLDEKGNVWFEREFSMDTLSSTTDPESAIAQRIIQILNAAKRLNPSFLVDSNGVEITTELDFPIEWGLGTSSTLINNIAQWAEVDAFKLLKLTFGGSGYDIACASNDKPIIYFLENEKPNVVPINFAPPFASQLYFIYLNKKQDSREGIAHYKKHISNSKDAIGSINEITTKMISCEKFEEFKGLVDKHELIIGEITKQIPVQQKLFKDFNGSIKSLGAWGGDFVLVCSESDPTSYFKEKGYHSIIPYNTMVL